MTIRFHLVALLSAIVVTYSMAATAEPKWQVEITGMPALSGGVVMPLTIGSIHKSNLIGANAIVNFSVIEGETIAVDSAQVYYLDSGARCDLGSGSAGKGGLSAARENDRLVVSGEISCREADAEPQKRTIAAWYRQ